MRDSAPRVDLQYELYTRRDVTAIRITSQLRERGEPLQYDIRLRTTQHRGGRFVVTVFAFCGTDGRAALQAEAFSAS